MKIELEKHDRVPFPTGILDFATREGDEVAYVACMDGIYELTLPSIDQAAAKGEPKAKSSPHRIAQHSSYVSGIGVIEDKQALVSTAYDGTLHIRDLPSQDKTGTDVQAADAPDEADAARAELAPRFSERIHKFWSWDMALSPDKRKLASVSGQYLAGAEDYSPRAADEPTVKVFDARSGRLLHAFDMLPSVQCVAFDPSSRYVAAGNLMGDVSVWDVESGMNLAKWRTNSFTSWGIIKSHCYIGGIFAISFSPDSESLFVAGMGEMRDPMAGNGKQLWQRFAWRMSPPEKIQETIADQAGEGLMETLAWHPDGTYFVMGGRLRGGNWNLGVFATDTGQLVGQAKTGMRITTARFTADGNTLILAGMQGQPEPKQDRFGSFGYLERYRLVRS